MPDFGKLLSDHQKVMKALEAMLPQLDQAAALLVDCLRSGNKILLCGNGGSAADAQHVAAEIVGRFETERRGLPALALTTDSSILTASGNDRGFDSIFARQVQALAQPGDLLIAYSTSGNSSNVLAAVREAGSVGCDVLSLTGKGGGDLAGLANLDLCVPSDNTARIQEAHGFIGHALCAAIDEAFE